MSADPCWIVPVVWGVISVATLALFGFALWLMQRIVR